MTFKIKDSLSIDGSVVIDQSKNITANDLTVNGTLTANGSAVQPQLVSGTSIKTVNGTSLLGSGNIAIAVPTAVSQLTNDSAYLTSATVASSVIDDSSTTSTTKTWSADKLNTTVGNIEAALTALLGV